jgi:hypothetical protein
LNLAVGTHVVESSTSGLHQDSANKPRILSDARPWLNRELHVLDKCLMLQSMPLDYMQILLDLMEDRQKWASKRDEAIREISRLSELIRATMNMIPPEQLARYEPIFERIEQRPLGLSVAIRACFAAAAAPAKLVEMAKRMAQSGKAESGDGTSSERLWLTPVEIRDRLKSMGFPFENYKANPLASIHKTLKRMVPGEMEIKTLKGGQKVYRLKSAGDWAQALAEARDWMKSSVASGIYGATAVVKKRPVERPEVKGVKDRKELDNLEGAKHGSSGSA